MAIRKKTNSDNVLLWNATKDAREKVENWPAWKRNLKVTQFSVGFGSQSPGNIASDGNRKCAKSN